MSVLFATPECAPLAKTGGLGDVSAALPAALRALGVDVRVLLPGYPAVLAADPGAREIARLEVFAHSVRLLESRLPSGVALLVADCPSLYARGGGPYQEDDDKDWEDNALRFGVFSKVAATLGSAASPLAWRPDVIHCNDWPTGLVSLYLRYAPRPRAAVVMTVHNLAFQGQFETGEISRLELPPEALGIEGLEFHGRVSFMKGGLVYADAITTVSPTYAREIQTKELGFGLDGVVCARRDVLHGVLNGIDTAAWNPETDPHIVSRYGVLTLERKLASKRALRRKLGLEAGDDVPLLGSVGRITHQKGVDLIARAAPELAALPAQLVVVGTGDREIVERLRAARALVPQAMATFIGFDEALAHLIEAGADMFLMPSRFEPCGMNQMYSQRYGTPPIASATGGLLDTIVDAAADPGAATGFLIPEATAEALVEGVRRAVAAYRDAPRWRRLQSNGMRRDFGWERPAETYMSIYERALSAS